MAVQPTTLLLASTSKYRGALLEKLGIAFTQVDPEYIEAAIEGEAAAAKSLRLARGKAGAAATLLKAKRQAERRERQAVAPILIVGSDQVAHCNATSFSKPGNYNNAFKQLKQCSGNWVTVSTGVCLKDAQGRVIAHFCEEYHLRFRNLDDNLIRWYLELEQPYDCAGSIKAEAHGITLIEDARGQDINTLYGLPLIRLQTELSKAGLRPNS
jgi:MAF protein